MRYKVLLVDDDSAHRIFASRAIMRSLYDVQIVECVSVPEANNTIGDCCCCEKFFDIAVLDLKLDHESGLDVVSVIRDKFNQQEFPIVIISTSDLSDHITEAYLCGANCYIVKDSDPMLFCQYLEKAIRFCLGL